MHYTSVDDDGVRELWSKQALTQAGRIAETTFLGVRNNVRDLHASNCLYIRNMSIGLRLPWKERNAVDY